MSGDRRRARDVDVDGGDDRRNGHTFKDPGPPIQAAPYEPIARSVPEHALAIACLAERADYGGPLAEPDLARLAQMAAALAETNAALMKRERERDADKAARLIREARRAPVKEQKTCPQCEAVFLTGKANKKFCTSACVKRWHKRVAGGECQPAGEAARVPAAQNHPAETDAQAGRAATGNHVSDWSARLRDRAAGYRATFQQVG